MKHFLTGLAVIAVLTATALADTYNGNGATGFGGALGSSTLTVTNSGTTVNFSLSVGPNGFSGNNIIIFIDSIAGGIADTSTLTDQADGGREAISGFSNPSRTLASFAPGFGADFAISLDSALNGNLFNLSTPSNFGFVTGVNFMSPSTNVYTFSISLANIGLSNVGQSFSFVASLISPTAFRSDESIGTITPTGVNPGFTGAITYTNFNSFTTVPEPSSFALLGTSLIFGAASLLRRRKS